MKRSLERERRKIDALDRRITRLLNRRFAIASGLGPLKKRLRDLRREARVLKNVSALSKPAFRRAVRAVYAGVMRQALLLQRGPGGRKRPAA